MVSDEDREDRNDKKDKYQLATFAGGCFWCMEAAFAKMEGVKSVVSGYTGGMSEKPTYEEVCSGRTGHFEAVQVAFDPSEISYEALLDTFWTQIDPTDNGGSFVDRGSQYRSAIFFHNQLQKEASEESKKRIDESKKFADPVATEIIEIQSFYPAEEYHQEYHLKNPQRYMMYRIGSGREAFIKRVWNQSDKADKEV